MKLILLCIVACTISCLLIGATGCSKSSMKSLFRSDSIESADSLPITIWHDSFDVAVRESEKTGKPILADFTGSDWCHWCVKLRQDVFETATFKSWARENVVLLELDYPKRGYQKPELKQQNAELAERFEIASYPTVLLLDAEGQVLGRMGYMPAPTEWIEAAELQLSSVTGRAPITE